MNSYNEWVMYEFLGLNRINYYITKNLPFTALPRDLTRFKYWTQTLDFPTESGKNRLWSISFVTTQWEQTKWTLPGSSGCVVKMISHQLASINAVGRFEYFAKWFLSINTKKKVFIKTILRRRIFNSLGGGDSRRKRRNMPLRSRRNIDGFITMSHHKFCCPSIQVGRHTKIFVDGCFYAIFWNIMIRSVGREHVGTVMRRNCYGDYIWFHT